VDFLNQSAFIEEEEPDLELTERITRFLKLTEGLRVTEAGISLSADSDCNEQRTAAAGQRIVRLLLSCCERILDGKRHLCECVFCDIFSDIRKFSVVKEESLLMMPCPVVAACCCFQLMLSDTLMLVSHHS